MIQKDEQLRRDIGVGREQVELLKHGQSSLCVLLMCEFIVCAYTKLIFKSFVRFSWFLYGSNPCTSHFLRSS